MLVTATNELKFHHWPREGVEEQYNLSITSDIVSLSWSKDNNFLIYLQEGGRPEILSLKDVNNIKPIHIITAIDKATVAKFQRKTKKCVAIGTASATIALYDTKTKSIAKLFTLPASVVTLDFNANDEYLAVACLNGTISLFNVIDGTETTCFNVDSTPSALCFHHTDHHIIAVGNTDGVVFVYTIQEIIPIYITKNHCAVVNGLVFCTKQDSLISIGEDHKFCVYDYNQKSCTFRGHLQYPLTGADVTPDGKYLAIGDANGSITIYDTKNYLTPLINWKPHCGRVSVLKFCNKIYDDITPSDNSLSLESTNNTENSSNKLRNENEFKSLYDKFINKTDDQETLKLLQDDIVADIQKDADQLHSQMKIHMANLQDFIKKEFEKMSMQMDDKWNLLNIISGNYRSIDHLSEPTYDNDNPIVLE